MRYWGIGAGVEVEDHLRDKSGGRDYLFQKMIVMSRQVPRVLNLVMPRIPTSLPPKVKGKQKTSLQLFFFFFFFFNTETTG